MLGQRIGRGDIDHAPIGKGLLRTADARIHQDRPRLLVQDHEPVHWPGAAVGSVEAGQVQPEDARRGHYSDGKEPIASSTKSAAR